MQHNQGVPASPSGYSAEPEPSCTVSAVPVSIPNAWPLMGFAPGGYMGKCHTCEGTMYEVDKRALRCLDCAAREAKRVIEMLSERELELLRKVENYGNLIAYLASDTHDVKPDAIRTLARNALAASADTRPEGGDSTKIEAPFTGGAVPHEDAADAQPTPVSDPISNKGER